MIATATATAAHRVKGLPKSIQTLIEKVENQNNMTPRLAAQLMMEADIQMEDVIKYNTFNHSAADGYGRRTLFESPEFEILVMSWAPGDFSAIHDHGAAQWGAVKCFGHAEHAVFKLEDDKLYTKCRKPFTHGDVNPVDHDLIHQMGNMTDRNFCSLHMYGCYDPTEGITVDSRVYDLLEERVELTTGGVFFCLPKDCVDGHLPCPDADYATTMRHHVEMHKRIVRMLPIMDETEALLERKARIEELLFSPEMDARFLRDKNELLDDNGAVICQQRWDSFWYDVTLCARYKAGI